jgi:tRNA nucleotidyltransferase (CCA-adding enzyme)
MQTLHYPQQLQDIFQILINLGIKPIIVGGYVRDFFLHKSSKDIDVELYNCTDLEAIITPLKVYGSVNSVGKSFGVLKLTCKEIEIDFSLPRKDTKMGDGHKGFCVQTDTTLTFQEASKRRDFTINAMGFDVVEQKFLDPYGGEKDLQNRCLRAVDVTTFGEDPLRVLRIIQMSSRFDLGVDTKLLNLAKKMVAQDILAQLPKERIFLEFEKLFVKSSHPSKGLKLLQEMGGFHFFKELATLNDEAFTSILKSIDRLQTLSIKSEKEKVLLSFALLSRFLNNQLRESFLSRFTNDKKILSLVEKLTTIVFNIEDVTDYDLYKLATDVEPALYMKYLYATYSNTETNVIDSLFLKLKELHILYAPLKPLVKGSDLIALGRHPSPEFKIILENIYDLQMQGKFHTKEEALYYLICKKRENSI